MRARPIEREAILQKHIKMWVREALAVDHDFRAFDRSKLVGQAAMQNASKEKMRGVTAGTPDTLLQVAGIPDIWCELKWPPNKVMPGDNQDITLRRLQALGRTAFWVQSVTEYYRTICAMGVPLQRNAAFLAMHHDGSVASEIARAELKAGKPKAFAKPRAKRATAGDVAKWRRAGVLV